MNPKLSKNIHLQLYVLKANNNFKTVKIYKYIPFSKTIVTEYDLKETKEPFTASKLEVKMFQYFSINKK